MNKINLNVILPKEDGYPYNIELEDGTTLSLRFSDKVELAKILSVMSMSYEIMNTLEALYEYAKNNGITFDDEYGEILHEDIVDTLNVVENRKNSLSKITITFVQ
jgi:hypothetical protein